MEPNAVVLALVGHSAAGKSDCASLINGCGDGDMDAGLGMSRSPTLETALEWLLAPARPDVVVISNHEEMLKCIHSAKLNNRHQETFERIAFVYLRKPKDRLRRHLALPRSEGPARTPDAQRYTLDTYEQFDRLFSDIASRTVDCSTASTRQVSDAVREFLGRCDAKNQDVARERGTSFGPQIDAKIRSRFKKDGLTI